MRHELSTFSASRPTHAIPLWSAWAGICGYVCAYPAPDPETGGRITQPGDRIVARRPNYDFQKRQKELKRQEKQAEKAERKRLRREGAEEEGSIAQPDGDDGQVDPDTGDEE